MIILRRRPLDGCAGGPERPGPRGPTAATDRLRIRAVQGISGLAILAMLGVAAGPARAQAAGAPTDDRGGAPPVLEGSSGSEGSDDGRCISLAEAERLALEGNRTLAAGRARVAAAEARAGGAGAFRLPALAAEAGFTRSDDPVAAFGTRLRQGRFAESDFALDALNHPAAVDDWSGGLGLQWAALDPGRWAGLAAARHGARAAALGSERTAEAVVFQTRVLYLDAVRAAARLDAARTAEEAARSTAGLMGRRFAQGLVTEADVLQAEAGLAAARATTTAAEREVADARGRLALHLGLGADSAVVPADSLAPVPEEPGPEESTGPGPRADLAASLEQVEAAEAGLRRARMARLPSVEAFARVSSHAPDPLDGRETNMTVGLQLSLPVFTGGALSAATDEARAMERAARLEHEDRVARARTELREARRAVEAARRGALAAEAARVAADEAHRLMRRRFEEGMATTAELLQAESRAAELRTRAVDARAGYHQALAALAFARGDEPTDPRDPDHD